MDFFSCISFHGHLLLRAVPDEKIWESLKAKRYIFVWLVEVGCFSIQWVVVFGENVIL